MNQVGYIAGNIPTLLRKLTPTESKAHTSKIMVEHSRMKPIQASGKGFAQLHNGDVVSVTWDRDEWRFDPGQTTVRFTVKVGERVFATKDDATNAPTNREFWAL